MSARDADAIRLEAEYWKAIAEDVLAVNDGIVTVADTLTPALPALVDLLMAPLTGPTPARVSERADAVLDALNATLEELRRLQAPLRSVIDLAGGRMTALLAEAEELAE